jgi:hypothetical protein
LTATIRLLSATSLPRRDEAAGQSLTTPIITTTRSEHRAFLAAFFDQLGPERRARIDFIHGPSVLKRTIQIAASAAFTAAFIGLIIFQLFSSDLWQDNNWLLIPLALLMGSLCAGLLYLSIKKRRTPFDPLAILEMLLPMLKRR